MSENKRANFVTVDSVKKPKPKACKTIRISLDLFEPNKKKFPEFNYKDLVKDEETHRKEEWEKKGSGQNGIRDPFSDNDEDVERIAKQFEQKYGSASTYGRRKGSCKQEDYADIGAGYDENDSFIDNTDGYDEMVPPECDTVYGGFYINSGSLEFKNVVGMGVDLDDASPTHRQTRKRILSTSESEEESSSEGESETSTGEKRHSEEECNVEKLTDNEKSGEDVKKKVKFKESNEEVNVRKKRRKSSQDSVHHVQPDEQPPSINSNVKKSDTSLECKPPAHVPENQADVSTDSQLSDSPVPVPVPSSDNAVSSDSSREAEVPLPSSPVLPKAPTIPPLPPNLPSEAGVLVKRLKAMADVHWASHTGKLSGPEVNEIILGMEEHCRKGVVPPSVRNALFSHAAALLKRGKPGLIQRARRLADENQRINSSRTTIDKLKSIIEKMKPALLENYKLESDRVMETNKNIALQNSTSEDDKKIPEKRLPKRRFPWNDQVRSLISNLLKEQNIPEEDEPMSKFLHAVVFPLFPSGFVRMPTLLQQAKLSKNIKPSDKSKSVPKNSEKIQNTSLNKSASKISNEVPIIQQSDQKNITQSELLQRTNKFHTVINMENEHKDIEKKNSETSVRNELNTSSHYARDDSEKSKPHRIHPDSIMQSRLGDSISISVTSSSHKRSETEKLSPSPPRNSNNSLTITPVPSVHKESKSHQVLEKLFDKPEILSAPQSNVNLTKSKSSGNAHFDKSTIAKIISCKNTESSIKPDNRDIYKPKSQLDYHRSEKSLSTTSHIQDLISKPSNLPDSPLPMLSKTYLGTSEPSVEDLKPSYNIGKEAFIKPKYKADYHRSSGSYSSGYHVSQDPKLSDNKYQRESSKSPHDRSYESLNLSPSLNHSMDNISGITSNSHGTSILKQHRIHKKYEDTSPIMADSKNNSKYFESNHGSNKNYQQSLKSVDDSSSDDCVEIVGDNYKHKKAKTFYEKEDVKEVEGVRRELEKHYPKPNQGSLGNIKTDFSIKSIVDDKPYSVNNILKSSHTNYENVRSSDCHNLSVIHNKTKLPEKSVLKYPNIKRQAILENEAAEMKKYKQCESVEERNNYEHGSDNSSVICEPVSVIKDNFLSKSDSRYCVTDHPRDQTIKQTDELIHDLENQKDCASELELHKVMQNLKELQDLQLCSQEESHKRLYDDGTNKLYRTNQYTSDSTATCNTKYRSDRNETVLKNQSGFTKTGPHNMTGS